MKFRFLRHPVTMVKRRSSAPAVNSNGDDVVTLLLHKGTAEFIVSKLAGVLSLGTGAHCVPSNAGGKPGATPTTVKSSC